MNMAQIVKYSLDGKKLDEKKKEKNAGTTISSFFYNVTKRLSFLGVVKIRLFGVKDKLKLHSFQPFGNRLQLTRFSLKAYTDCSHYGIHFCKGNKTLRVKEENAKLHIFFFSHFPHCFQKPISQGRLNNELCG